MKVGRFEVYLHPIATHFSNALYPVALFFLALHAATGKGVYFEVYRYVLLCATASVPVSYATGIIDWKTKYHGARVRLFRQKLRYGAVVFVLGSAASLWAWGQPAAADAEGIPGVAFYFLNFAVLPPLMYVGHLGGMLVFRGLGCTEDEVRAQAGVSTGEEGAETDSPKHQRATFQRSL